MEMTIDRTSYRRSNIRKEELVVRKKTNTKVFLNETIIAMAMLISVLLIKLLDLQKADEWIENTLVSGIPYEELCENVTGKYEEYKQKYLLIQSEENLEINNLKANKEENKSGEIMEVIENASATTMIYETAVEGVNQLSDDAEKIKEKYKLITPVKGTITSHFGCRDTNNPIVSSYHVGLDIAANTGTTIVASHNGEIIEAGTIGTYGKCIMIKQDELITVYAHCSKINVKKGETIKQGEKIGEVGMTGNATGPHVHFEVRYNERYVNPEDII